jgi:hypothetical protein
MDDDEIADFLDQHGHDLLLRTGHTPLKQPSATGRWSHEDADWLWERAHEPDFIEWARNLLKSPPPA